MCVQGTGCGTSIARTGCGELAAPDPAPPTPSRVLRFAIQLSKSVDHADHSQSARSAFWEPNAGESRIPSHIRSHNEPLSASHPCVCGLDPR